MKPDLIQKFHQKQDQICSTINGGSLTVEKQTGFCISFQTELFKTQASALIYIWSHFSEKVLFCT